MSRELAPFARKADDELDTYLAEQLRSEEQPPTGQEEEGDSEAPEP